MSDLSITLVQTDLHWLDPEANRNALRQLIADIPQATDLIVLPEMFTSGFTMTPETVAEPANGPTLSWLQQVSKENRCAVTGSIVVEDQGRYFNRLYFVTPEGDHQHYDKRHLFRMAQEQEHYQPGRTRLVLNYKGWRICPMICYDLRFPVWCRNRQDYDLLIFVANWPTSRHLPWRTLLQARAIENLSYVAGVNRIGVDGNGVDYNGQSLICDAPGKLVMDAQDRAGCFTQTLSLDALQKYRTRFPAHLDADPFHLE